MTIKKKNALQRLTLQGENWLRGQDLNLGDGNSGCGESKILVAKAGPERAETLLGFCEMVAPFSGAHCAQR